MRDKAEAAETGERLLAALREAPDAPAAQAARHALAHVSDPAGDNAGERQRAQVAAALAHDLRPTDRSLTHWLLQQEVAAQAARGVGASEALFTLVAALARFAQPADALLLWRAREATPETRAGVDVEQLARAGLDPVRATLERAVAAGGPEAAEARGALAWLDAGAAAGAFADLPGYFAWADERFGLNVSGPT